MKPSVPLLAAVALTFSLTLIGIGESTVAADDDETPSEPQQAEPQPLDADEQQALDRRAAELQRRARQLAADRQADEPTDVDALLRRIPPPRGPSEIFEWIDDNIETEPYIGSLRGARGTLVAGAGNAIDQALLARKLLDNAGYQTRFVTGTLHETDAVDVLENRLGEATLVGGGDGSPLPAETGEAARRTALVDTLANHVWLEVVDDEARPFDPVAAPGFGMTPAESQSRHDKLPDPYRTRFEVMLVSELDDGRQREHLVVDADLSDLAFEAITLGFEADPTRPRGHRPVVVHGDRSLRGETVPVTNTERLELQFRFETTNRQIRWDQVLYRKGQGIDAFDFDHQHFAIAIAPGWTSDNQLRSTAGSAAADALDKLDAWLSAEAADATPIEADERRRRTNTLLDDLGAALPFAVARTLDRTTRRAADHLGVVPFMTRPRVLTTGLLRDGDEVHLDLQIDGDRLEALPRTGIPALATRSYLSLHGLMRDRLIGEVLETYGDHPVTTVGRVFDLATSQSVPFTTVDTDNIDRIDHFDVDETTRETLRRLIRRRNMTILAPTARVQEEDVERFGWWAVGPLDGNLEGHTSDALLAVAEEESGRSATDAVVSSYLDLIERHLRAADHATADRQRFPELACDASDRFSRLGRAFCATERPLSMPEIDSCLQNPPQPAGDLLSLQRIDCQDRLAPLRCAAVFGAALVEGRLAVIDDPDEQPPSPLCD